MIDVLETHASPNRAKALMRAVHAGAVKRGHDVVITHDAVRAGALLVLYGLGGPERVHHENRRGLIAFDSGYWDRKLDSPERKYRVAFNGFHSPQFVMGGEHLGDRLGGLSVAESGGDPAGPIMLVGNAPKSNAVGAAGWTAAMSRRIAKAFPGRRVLYRPKPRRPTETGVQHDELSNGSLEVELRRVSLVVCRHSNVAIDACIAGVPVVCESGAAAAIYPTSIVHAGEQPLAALRTHFIERLAWWQWSAAECASGAFWRWAEGWLDAIR